VNGVPILVRGPEVGTGLPAAVLLAAVLIHKLGDAFTEVEA